MASVDHLVICGARDPKTAEQKAAFVGNKPVVAAAGGDKRKKAQEAWQFELKKVLWLERQRKHEAQELQRVFDLPGTEEPLDDFSCALQRAILMHGRLFVSHEHVCFSSNVFGVRSLLALPFREVSSIAKGMHSLINPSIHVRTATEEHIFASFWRRDLTFRVLQDAWTAYHDRLWIERIRSGSPPTTASATAATAAAAADPSPIPVATAAALQHGVQLGEGALLGCSAAEAESLLLSDGSPFLEEFKAAQGGSAISVGAWQSFAGGSRVREVRFVQPVRSRLSPVRETRVEETQQCSRLPCGSVIVQSHQVMVDTPYGDCFAVLAKWVFAPLPAAAASGDCSVSVSAELTWFKDTWLKKQIVSGALEELDSCYEVFLPTIKHRLAAADVPMSDKGLQFGGR